MKTLNSLLALCLCTLLLYVPDMNAQEENRPAFITMTRTHWNFDVELTDDFIAEWEAMEAEYMEKVVQKNEYIMGTVALQHYYTGDNTELVLVSTYKSWEDIQLAQARNGELVEEGWPDEDERDAFFEKYDNNYVNVHSDEIYRTVPGAKFPPGEIDTSMVVYIQKVQLAYPADGSEDDFNALHGQWLENVVKKNPHVVAYYPLHHAWGSDNRDFLQIYVVSSLCDIEMMNQAIGGLVEAAWPDEDARKEFNKQYNRYFTGVHGDYIYSTIPEMAK